MGLLDYGYGERKKKQKRSSSSNGMGFIIFLFIVFALLATPFKIIRIFLPFLIALGIAGGLVYGVYWIFS